MAMVIIRAAFTTQEQVYLSWPVLLTSLLTDNSLSNMSVMDLYFSFGMTLTVGGCHVILVRCCTGAVPRVQIQVKSATVTGMMVYGARTAVL